MISLKSLLPDRIIKTSLTGRNNLGRMAGMKNLLMEAVSAKDMEAFIRDMIKGTEWEGKVFAVGGFVRDEVMGKQPKDLDVVVNEPQGGIKFTIWLGKKLGIYQGPSNPPPPVPKGVKVDQIGRPYYAEDYETLVQCGDKFDEYIFQFSNPVIFPKFGTANLRLDGVNYQGKDFTGESIDAVMPRAEQYHDPSVRKPTDVGFTTLDKDAERRDLTVNAIYKDISSGKLFDPVDGVSDIKNKILKTLISPDEIYQDDALRMFRAIRFAVNLGFELSPEIIAGIKRNLPRLRNTSKERIRDELNKILKSPDPVRGIQLLRDTGLLPYVGSELQQMVGMSQNIHHKHDVFDHTLEVLKNTKPVLYQRLLALFHDIGKVATRSETPTGVHFYGHEDVGPDIAEKILRSLKYPNDIIDAVKLGIKNHMRLKSGGDTAVKLSDKSLRKFKIEVGEKLEDVLDVIHADNISHADASSMPNQIEQVRKRLSVLDVQVKKPNLPINGNDLMALGLKPGPVFTQILGAVTDAWYANPNITKEEGLTIAKQIAGV